MTQKTNGIYEFGSFRLDAQERLLQRDGATISFTPKAFDLLLALLERHGRLVERETGQKRRLTTPQTRFGDGQPAISPDGKTVLFTRDHNPDLHDLYLVPITGGEPQQVLFDQETSVSRPTWTPDGRAILYTSNSGRGGPNDLYKVPVTGGTPMKVEAVGEKLSNFVLSRQGNRLAWAQSLDDLNIWRMELDATEKSKTAPQPLIASTSLPHWKKRSVTLGGPAWTFPRMAVG